MNDNNATAEELAARRRAIQERLKSGIADEPYCSITVGTGGISE